MKYESVDDLPKGIRNLLPKKVQAEYLEIYNEFYEVYDEGSVAHKKTWGKLKSKYDLGTQGVWSKNS